MMARKHSRHQEILILYQNQNVNTKQETMKLVFFHLLKKASAQNADFNILGGMKTPAILEALGNNFIRWPTRLGFIRDRNY